MKKETRIQVFCGETIESFCNRELHPANETKRAINIFKALVGGESFKMYTNNPDFVSAMKHLADKHEVDIEFFLNNISQGREIEGIFEDFNRSIKLLNEACQ